MEVAMASSVSERIVQIQQSLSPTPKTSGESLREEHAVVDAAADSSSSWTTVDQESDLAHLIRSCRKIGETPVIGVTRLDTWTNASQQSFLRFSYLVESALQSTSTIRVVPWNVANETAPSTLLSLGSSETKFDSTLISRMLRELQIWKKQSGLVIVELGMLNANVSSSIGPWCNAIFLLTHGKLPQPSLTGRQLSLWRQKGLPLTAAIHAA
jgi:hypothetical protein